MKRIKFALAIALCVGSLGGCSHVTSAQAGDAGLTGEAWYVRTAFFGNSKVFYCPANSTVCYRADMD